MITKKVGNTTIVIYNERKLSRTPEQQKQKEEEVNEIMDLINEEICARGESA